MKPMIIAEAGHNGNGSMKVNKALIEEAKECGASAIKFQLYDVLKIKHFYQSRYAELWAAQLEREDILELKNYADRVGIEFMASAFDPERVQWLEEIWVKRHKLASRSIFDKELIEAMEKTGKPIIVSLGHWREKEFPRIKNAKFFADYPALPGLPDDFERYDGLSDNTIGMETCVEAVKRGAKIIEKHFTLDKHLPGYNQAGSADPTDFKDFCKFVKNYAR